MPPITAQIFVTKLEKLWLRCAIDDEHRSAVLKAAPGITHGDFKALDGEVAALQPSTHADVEPTAVRPDCSPLTSPVGPARSQCCSR